MSIPVGPIILRRGTTQRIQQAQEVPEDGMPIVETTASGEKILRIGDGARLVKDLEPINSIYQSDTPTTVSFQGIPAGSVLKGVDSREILRRILSPYQAVVLNSASVTPNTFEIGQTITGNLSVTCSVSNSANLNPGASYITSNPLLFAQQSINPLVPATIAITTPRTYNDPISLQVTVTAVGQGGELSARNATISVLAPVYFGTSVLEQITNATQLATLTKSLRSSRTGTYNFAGGGYTHFLVCNKISVSGIGFVDIDITTGNPLFTYAMQAMPDLSVSNGYITITLKCYRSVNFINAATRMQVV
jgi:hypothetical protein